MHSASFGLIPAIPKSFFILENTICGGIYAIGMKYLLDGIKGELHDTSLVGDIQPPDGDWNGLVDVDGAVLLKGCDTGRVQEPPQSLARFKGQLVCPVKVTKNDALLVIDGPSAGRRGAQRCRRCQDG